MSPFNNGRGDYNYPLCLFFLILSLWRSYFSPNLSLFVFAFFCVFSFFFSHYVLLIPPLSLLLPLSCSFFAMSHQIKLFVDGVSAFEASLKYPRTTEPFAFNYIGTGANLTDPKKVEKKASFYGRIYPHSFYLKHIKSVFFSSLFVFACISVSPSIEMASVYLYKSALSASEIAELHKQGPNYLWSPE